MKTKIEIKFLQIAGKKMDKEMKENKAVQKSLNNFSKKLCKNLDKYLRESNIKAKIDFKLE